MHFRELEKSNFFGKRVEWEIFQNQLGCKVQQFQRLLSAMQHLLQNILKFNQRSLRFNCIPSHVLNVAVCTHNQGELNY